MMNANRTQIKNIILEIVSRGLVVTTSPNVSNEQYRTWQNYAQMMLRICSYQYNPTIYINYLKVCTDVLSIPNNNEKMRLCINYLIGVVKIL